MAPGFNEIDQKRQRMGLSEHALCKKAAVHFVTYWRLKTGATKSPSPRTMERLTAALENRPPRAKPLPPGVLRQYFNTVLALCAQAAGLRDLDAIATDPHANRPRDLNWIAAMRVRQVAIYVVSTEGNVSGAELARAIGTTKQAISKARRTIEDRRDDPAFDALLDRVGELMRGKAA